MHSSEEVMSVWKGKRCGGAIINFHRFTKPHRLEGISRGHPVQPVLRDGNSGPHFLGLPLTARMKIPQLHCLTDVYLPRARYFRIQWDPCTCLREWKSLPFEGLILLHLHIMENGFPFALLGFKLLVLNASLGSSVVIVPSSITRSNKFREHKIRK